MRNMSTISRNTKPFFESQIFVKNVCNPQECQYFYEPYIIIYKEFSSDQKTKISKSKGQVPSFGGHFCSVF